jgi:archaellum component FlaF (FlaF/FlaG flagellin family)
MKKIKVLLDFIKLPVAEKTAFYRNVIVQLTDNALYANPDVSMIDAKSATDALESSFLAASDGSHTAVSILHANETAVDNLFRLLAAYVERIAAGDESKILNSGFHVSKQPVPLQKATLTVNDGANSGTVKLVAKAVERAGAYIWQYAKDTLPENDIGWIHITTSTRASYDVTVLTVTCKYYFRVAAVTPNGITDFSAPVMKIVV